MCYAKCVNSCENSEAYCDNPQEDSGLCLLRPLDKPVNISSISNNETIIPACSSSFTTASCPVYVVPQNITIPSITKALFALRDPTESGSAIVNPALLPAASLIKPPFNVNQVAQIAATEALKDKKFINKSIKHNEISANKIKKFLENFNIFSNKITTNFLLLNFDKCKFSANYVFKKLQLKRIILRSTKDGYNIQNKLRLTIGSNKENVKFIKAIKNIFN